LAKFIPPNFSAIAGLGEILSSEVGYIIVPYT
jgi:hypothetical protein